LKLRNQRYAIANKVDDNTGWHLFLFCGWFGAKFTVDRIAVAI